MKKLLIIFTLLFTSVMFSSPSFAKWTPWGVGENNGITFYVDFERIRKTDGFVYYWTLSDLPKPDARGDLSLKLYNKGDCKLFRFKGLSFSFHSQQMGAGPSSSNSKFKNYNPNWTYPSPNSVGETILKTVCRRTK